MNDKRKSRYYKRIHRLKLRIKAYNLLGNQCDCCGEKCVDFLTVDHKNNNGNKHRKEIGRSSDVLNRAVIKHPNPTTEYRLLCANCHLSYTKIGYCIHNIEQRQIEINQFNQSIFLIQKEKIMNQVFVTGKLVADPQVRNLANNMKVTTFSVAVADGGKKQTTSFFDVDAWNKTAELIGKYFTKGQSISLQGKLRQDSYVDKKTNQTVKKVKIVVDQVLNLPQFPVQDEVEQVQVEEEVAF